MHVVGPTCQSTVSAAPLQSGWCRTTLVTVHAMLQITLVDKSDRFVFKPLLYELVNGTAQSWEVAPTFAQLLAPYPIQFIQVCGKCLSPSSCNTCATATANRMDLTAVQLVLCNLCAVILCCLLFIRVPAGVLVSPELLFLQADVTRKIIVARHQQTAPEAKAGPGRNSAICELLCCPLCQPMGCTGASTLAP